MPIRTIELDRARKRLSARTTRAHLGEPSILTKRGQPYAAIVPPEMLTVSAPRSDFLALRGSGKGLWVMPRSTDVESLRNEWD
jgi:antitoxin (DNA-binding transcriptional repressor) of toxin-antitoxin stability system